MRVLILAATAVAAACVVIAPWSDVEARSTPSVRGIPREHLALVTRWKTWGRGYGQTSYDPIRIYLPRKPRAGMIRHEVGHAVMAGYGLGSEWRRAFWRGGKSRGPLPSRYAETSYRDHFAEAYREYLEGSLRDCCPEQARWLKRHVPGMP